MPADALKSIISLVLNLYGFVLLVRIVMTWLPPDSHRSPVFDIIFKITEPLLAPCRELLNGLLRLIGVDVRNLPIDFSPILAYIALDVVKLAVFSLL